MKNIFLFFLWFINLALVANCYANNISVSNVSITSPNATAKTAKVQFDISWENSWRTGLNYDAAWVFIKYSTDSGTTWRHATLKTSGTTPTGFSVGSGTGIEIIVPTDKVGAFVQRSANGAGTLSTTSVQFVWDWGSDKLSSDGTTAIVSTDSARVKVFAIEMCYIPQGAFYVGDGTSSNINGHFESAVSGTAKQITGEDALILGGGGAGSLGNNHASGMNTDCDDFNDSTSQTLPAEFPKGYNAFYLMKYELSQGQYRDFLNTLTRTQQAARVATTVTAGTTSVTNRYVMANSSTLAYRNGIRCDATIHTSNPITFYCDLDGDGTPNETTDGEWISCNYLLWADLAAYADWVGLRPMSELEFEKAARGIATAVVDEYAWGTTNITQVTGISNGGLINETGSNTGNGLCVYSNNASVQGPLRSGYAANASTSRETSGAGYYGNMDLSDNIWERAVTVGNAGGRAFTGLHGDGVLSTGGDMDVTNWPVASTAEGTGFRGGNWVDVVTYVRTSARRYGSSAITSRNMVYGGRLCRTSGS